MHYLQLRAFLIVPALRAQHFFQYVQLIFCLSRYRVLSERGPQKKLISPACNCAPTLRWTKKITQIRKKRLSQLQVHCQQSSAPDGTQKVDDLTAVEIGAHRSQHVAQAEEEFQLSRIQPSID
jgi:hypothetical protein